jgi:exonuclease VII small subunit
VNGHVPDGDDVIRQARERLAEIGQVPHDTAAPLSHADAPAADGGRARSDIRHPEDPPGAYRDTAREVCDPEEIRVSAVATGKASQAIGSEVFQHWLQRAFKGICGVRSGAITGPARAAGGEQLKISATTSKDVKQIVVDRYADGLKADRLEADAIPRASEKVDRAKAEVKQAEEHLWAAQSLVDEVRTEGVQEDARPGGVMQWVRLPPRAAIAVTALDIAITTVVLEPPVSDLIDTQLPYGSFLIAAAVSASLIVASAAAGFALAAIRLPGRAVGALMVGVFAVIMLKLVGGLDALRAGSESGVETLTAVTLASCFVAALTSYAATTWHDFTLRRDRILEAGTPLGDALDARKKARTADEAATSDLAQAEAELEGLWAEIERLRDSAARADAAALTREQQGIAAGVEFATIDSRARTGVAQEVAANEEWAFSMALLAYEKARAEEPPEGDLVQDPDAPTTPLAADGESHRLTGLQKAAIGALGAGGVGGLLLGPIPLVAGAGIAAVLLLLGARRQSRSDAVAVDDDGPPSGPPPIGSPASDDDPLYIRQPDHMVAKYGDGGAMTGEHQ